MARGDSRFPEVMYVIAILAILGIIIVANYQRATEPPRQISDNIYHFSNIEAQLPSFLADRPALEVQSITAESYGLYGQTSGYKVVFHEKE